MGIIYTPTEPAWLKELPSTSRLDSKTIALIFGYARSGCISQAVTHDLFPKPDYKVKVRSSRGKQDRYYWKVSTVRKEIRRRNAIDSKSIHAHEYL